MFKKGEKVSARKLNTAFDKVSNKVFLGAGETKYGLGVRAFNNTGTTLRQGEIASIDDFVMVDQDYLLNIKAITTPQSLDSIVIADLNIEDKQIGQFKMSGIVLAIVDIISSAHLFANFALGDTYFTSQAGWSRYKIRSIGEVVDTNQKMCIIDIGRTPDLFKVTDESGESGVEGRKARLGGSPDGLTYSFDEFSG